MFASSVASVVFAAVVTALILGTSPMRQATAPYDGASGGLASVGSAAPNECTKFYNQGDNVTPATILSEAQAGSDAELYAASHKNHSARKWEDLRNGGIIGGVSVDVDDSDVIEADEGHRVCFRFITRKVTSGGKTSWAADGKVFRDGGKADGKRIGTVICDEPHQYPALVTNSEACKYPTATFATITVEIDDSTYTVTADTSEAINKKTGVSLLTAAADKLVRRLTSQNVTPPLGLRELATPLPLPGGGYVDGKHLPSQFYGLWFPCVVAGCCRGFKA